MATRCLPTRPAALVALLLLALAAPAPAETVILRLTNGDTLRGEMLERTDDQVRLDHPYLGEIVIPAEQVVNAGELPVELDPASPEAAAVTVSDEDTIVATPSFVSAAPDEAEAAVEEEIEEIKPGLLGTNLLKGWDRLFTLGLYGSEGNTQSLDVTAALDLFYEDDNDRWTFDATWFYGKEDGNLTDNEVLVNLRKDWLLPDSRWFFFALGSYEYDDFEAYQHRVNVSVGPGYDFIKEDDLALRGLAGIGAYREFGSDDDDIHPEGLLGLEFMWKPLPGQTFNFSHFYYPELERFEELRSRHVTRAEYMIDIDRDYGLSFKIGALNEYESQTDDDSFHNDFDYYAAIVYAF
jgi:putative salt-induced outer membrane protein YdiY